MRNIRSLPEIVQTVSKDRIRLAELVETARRGAATRDEIRELGTLDAERHAFERVCRRWAPLAPIALGFEWGDELRHEGSDIVAVVREGDMVEIDGASMTLLEATRKVARSGVRAALGAWCGPAGSVGELAGLNQRHPDEAASISTAEANTQRKDPERSQTPPGGNYDLFG